MRLLARVLLNGIAIIVAAWFVPGLSLRGPGTALIAGAILGIVNALVRPVLIILTLPLTLVTLGLFIFVVNALCLGATAALVPGFGIAGFWSAFLGALVVSVVSWILNGLVLDPIRRESSRPRRS
jgi:putative membrane protein